MKINVLEPRIFNKIAAGEVVERPASIIKELVENSVDAGAKHITIEIENGGISKIRVIDDGCGIDFDDLQRAFLPHATSKIKEDSDLFEIKTLGFRGEALASIGAVSFVSLISKTKDSSTGGTIQISGGDMGVPTICGADNGTDITVQNLFYNVPARAKFLKKPKTEESEITDLVEKFILSNPTVSIKYIIDGKIRHISNGKGMMDAIYEVYGKNTLDNLLYFEQEYDDMRIYGFTSKPEFSKPNRTYQTIIINNRYIKNTTIQSAVTNAYGEVLMKKQFPFFVIYLDMDFSAVDVNVHPNKMEVRFENGNNIYPRVFELINKTINSIDYTRTYQSKQSETLVDSLSVPDDIKNITIEENNFDINKFNIDNEKLNKLWESEEVNISASSNTENNIGNLGNGSKEVNKLDTTDQIISNLSKKYSGSSANIFTAMELSSADDVLKNGISFGSKLLNKMEAEQEEIDVSKNQSIRILGVLFKTYIVIEYQNSMLLVDQHAGHERILFDQMMESLKNQKLAIQQLLVPYVLDVNAVEENYILEHIEDLKTLGFDVEEFGDKTFKVSTVPYILEDVDFKEFFDEFLQDMKNPKVFSFAGSFRDKVASMACKAAVKGGDELSYSEVAKLIELFAENNTKLLCPHGRPVVIKVTENEIERWFKRIV